MDFKYIIAIILAAIFVGLCVYYGKKKYGKNGILLGSIGGSIISYLIVTFLISKNLIQYP